MPLTTENLSQQIKDAKQKLKAMSNGEQQKILASMHVKMQQEVERIQDAEKTGSAIPQIDFNDIKDSGFTDEHKKLINQAGCVIIKNTIDSKTVEQKNQDVSDYIVDNGYYETKSDVEDNYFSQLKSDKPQIFGIYWSKAQIWARQHPNMAIARRHLNHLWRFKQGDKQFFNPDQETSYADRVRRREPGDVSLGLSPHVDSGSIERWIEPHYQVIYQDIFKGNWENYDPFDGALRVEVEEFPSPAVCSVFRTFQGWLALTPQGPKDGTLQMVPSTLAVPYMLIRALQDDLPDDELMASPGRALLVDKERHSILLEGLVSIPKVEPGDTVWWHPDTIHAVEDEHQGKGYSNVLFIGAAPDCAKNRAFLEKQKEAFLTGKSCPDFAPENFEINYQGRATEDDLTPLGRIQMGFD